ncbi:MAG: hypothetical protein JXB32_25545 [Deltaproteobacteria bacterium]|nr:hypothetical protein [Deltaproteobacteria bacterium]
MPVALRCPACHAPLPEAPGSEGLKCSYCGTLVQATRYLPAPVLHPPPEAPDGLAARIEQLRQGGGPRPAHSPVVRMLVLFFAIDAVIGIGIAAYFLLHVALPTDETAAVAGGGGDEGPRVLPAVELEPGTTTEIDLPAHSGGPTTLDLTFTVPAPEAWDAWYSVESVARSCSLTLLGADDEPRIGPLEDARGAWGWARLPAGPARLRLVCEESPIPQRVRVRAARLPRWDGTSPLRLRVEGRVLATGVVLPIDRDGVWAFHYRSRELSALAVLAPDGTVVGGGAPSDAATGELTLAAGEYVARFDGAADPPAEAELWLTRVGPEPLELGETVLHQPSDVAPRAHWLVKLGAPLRLAVTASAQRGTLKVELADAAGVPVASTEGYGRETTSTAAATTELPAGEYHVAVLSHDHSEFRVWAHEVGELRLLTPAERAAYQALRGCTCRTEADAEPGSDLVQLAARTTGSSFELLSQTRRFELRWSLDAGAAGPLELTVDDTTAPPRQVPGSRVGLGLACVGDTVVVAALDRVTAWSIARRRRLWSATLPGTHTRGRAAGGDELALNCGRLTVRQGVVAVPLEEGGRARIRVIDGVLQP